MFAVSQALPSSELFSQFDRTKRSGCSYLPALKQNKEWVPWQCKFELQCKDNLSYRIVDVSFDPKTLTNCYDREIWNKNCDHVNTMFNTHLKTSLAKMIRNDDSVKDRPHLLNWNNLVTYYGDYIVALSNASIIAICLSLSSIQVSLPRAWIF